MKKWVAFASGAVVALVLAVMAPAFADLNYTQGSGTVLYDFVCFTTKHCPVHVNVNSSGTEVGTATNPLRYDPTGTTAQPISGAVGSFLDGAIVSLGATSDTVCVNDTATCSLEALIKRNNQNLSTINTTLGGNLPGVTGPLAASSTNLATFMLMGGCQYLTTLPSMTNLQQIGELCSARGEKLVATYDTRPPSGSVTAQDIASTTTTGQNGVSIVTGTPTANSSYTQAINGQSAVRVQVTGTWTGTLQFEASVDGGATYVPASTVMVGAAFAQSTITGNGDYTANVAGFTNYRIRATAVMTGTASIQAVFAQVPASVQHSIQVPMTLGSGAPLVKGTTAAMTGTLPTQIIAAVTNQRIYVTRMKCNNTSSTATLVQITDGSGGTVLETLAAGATYGGEQATGSTPLLWTTSGNGLFAQNVTTGASVICTASGYSGG